MTAAEATRVTRNGRLNKSGPTVLLLTSLLTPSLLHAGDSEFLAQVLSVRTCGEVAVRHKTKIVTVRVSGIDCPSGREPWAGDARAFATKLMNGQAVTVKPHGHDRQRRVWADVFLHDGRSVAYEMVKAGWARVAATSVDERLTEMEEEARHTKQGIWQEPPPPSAPRASRSQPAAR
jgi:endonuclease YncB( thermonuclease family)